MAMTESYTPIYANRQITVNTRLNGMKDSPGLYEAYYAQRLRGAAVVRINAFKAFEGKYFSTETIAKHHDTIYLLLAGLYDKDAIQQVICMLYDNDIVFAKALTEMFYFQEWNKTDSMYTRIYTSLYREYMNVVNTIESMHSNRFKVIERDKGYIYIGLSDKNEYASVDECLYAYDVELISQSNFIRV